MFSLLTTFRAHSGNVLTRFDQLGDDIVCTVTWKHPFDDEVCEEVGRIELNINHFSIPTWIDFARQANERIAELEQNLL